MPHCDRFVTGVLSVLTSAKARPIRPWMQGGRQVGYRVLFAGLFLLLVALPVEAGRRPFLFLNDTEIVPEGDVELEEWLWSEGKIPATPNRVATYWIWWAPVVGLTNRLEVEVPFQIWASQNLTSLEFFSAELHWRALPREQEGGLQPLVRVAYNYAIRRLSRPSNLEYDLVLSYGRATQLHATIDVGMRLGVPPADPSNQPVSVTYGAGVAYPLPARELRLATEFRGESGITDTRENDYPRFSVGPSLAWSRGRIWVTFGCLFGLSRKTPTFIPRLLWAVAL